MGAKNLATKLLESHLIEGSLEPGTEIGIRIDQTLTQDATGTLAMLEFEALGIPHVKTELSAQYVDHNLLQLDFKNADDHLFLRSACQKYGVWYSPAGNGVSHPVHMERFGKPGKTLLGSDSHTCAAGALGMLAIGAGGLEVAMAMAGEPVFIKTPMVFGIHLTGRLPDWVSAKDVVLELLRRHGVEGGIGKIIEYHGSGVTNLSAMDRHVIANMGAELGATASVFPSDENTLLFLKSQNRENDFQEMLADEGASYHQNDEIDLSSLEPLIALPSSPGNVVPVHEVAGKEIYQAYIGSSANPGLRDFAVPAMMVEGKKVNSGVSFDINPSSRQTLQNMTHYGYLNALIHSGARIHQAGCNGCIGMGQAPATGRISLRTVPRNFPGRSGTREDQVYLCSPETATASALMGKITDPRTLDFSYPRFQEPDQYFIDAEMLEKPSNEFSEIDLIKGPNIAEIPDLDVLPASLEIPVLLKVGNDISTDEILPAGPKVLPFRSNIPEISRHCFSAIDENFGERALSRKKTPFAIVAGSNYGQGSSREHAALAPRYLGLRVVIAKSFARIHWQNLINFGIAPLEFDDPQDYDKIEANDVLEIADIKESLRNDKHVLAVNTQKNETYQLRHSLASRQIAILLAGGLIPLVGNKSAN